MEQAALYRYYCSNQEFGILNVGYHDFSVVKPATDFRTQNFYTWHFVVSGRGTLEIYGKRYQIKGGETFFIPPHTPMRYYPEKADPWEYVWFSFKGDLIEQYSKLVGFSAQTPVCTARNFEGTKHALKKLLESLSEDEGAPFRALSTFYQIMSLSTSHTETTEIRQVKKLLDENFATPKFSIEKLCRDVGISHAHLLRLFKEAYGTTLIRYLTEKRIELACELLRTTNLTARSVAYSCGFSDELHFMKTFKKATGKSALQYRREAETEARCLPAETKNERKNKILP